MKKIVILVIIAIIVVLGIVGFVSTREKELSKEDYIELMQKFEKVSNVKVEGPTKIYKRKELEVTVNENGLYTWKDSKNKECIEYYPDLKLYHEVEYKEEETELNDYEYTFKRI